MVTRHTIIRLAAEADIDPRSARKALTLGPLSLRGRAGEKALAAMQRLGLTPALAKTAPPPPATKGGADAAAE